MTVLAAIDLTTIKVENQDGKTFITLPNGDIIEFTLSSGDLMIDWRESLGGDSFDAVRINL